MPFPAWDAGHAARLDEPGLLLYRSNLLGSGLCITNYGGCNTSAKLKQRNPLTQQDVGVLWVMGSGGDLGSMKPDGLSSTEFSPRPTATRTDPGHRQAGRLPAAVHRGHHRHLVVLPRHRAGGPALRRAPSMAPQVAPLQPMFRLP